MTATGKCQETSGFLFKHACAHLADATCDVCHKQVCNRHLRMREHQAVCTSCAKKALQQGEDWRRERRYSRDPRASSEDPYFYAGYYYLGFGHWGHGHHPHAHDHHDPTDFTESDAQSLAAAGDEGFESDMGAS